MMKIVLASVISAVVTAFVIEKMTNKTILLKVTVTRDDE